MAAFLVLLSRFSCYTDYMVSSVSCGAEVDGHWDIKNLFAKYCVHLRASEYEQKACFGLCKMLFQTHSNVSSGAVLKLQLDCLGRWGGGEVVPSFCFSSFCSSSFCSASQLYSRPRKPKFPLRLF